MTSTPWLTVGENSSEWAKLVEQLDLADFFQLHAVHLADASLEAPFLSSLSDDWERWDSVEVWDLAKLPRAEQFDATLRSRLNTANGWCLVAGGAQPSALARAFAMFNQRRDVIRALLDGPMVVALHPLDWRIVRQNAPDFWSVHVNVSRFTAQPLPNPPRLPLERPSYFIEARRPGEEAEQGMKSTEASAEEVIPPYLIRRLTNAVIAAGVGVRSRRLLLFGISRSIAESLPKLSTPREQIYSDVIGLSEAGPKHLIGWLENVLFLTNEHRESLYELRDLKAILEGIAMPSPRTQAETSAEATKSQGVTAARMSLDRVVVAVHYDPPSVVREAMETAAIAVHDTGDRHLIARAHARIAWIHGHFGDRRSGLAEVEEGRRVARSLTLDEGDDLMLELDTIAHWLAR